MANTNTAMKNEAIWLNKLPKAEQAEALRQVKATPEIREMLRTQGGTFEFTFEYEDGNVTKLVSLPARFSWTDAIVVGGSAVRIPSAIPVKEDADEEETVSKKSSSRDSKKSSEEKSVEDKRAEKREKALETHKTSLSRSVINLLFGLAAMLIIGMLTGVIPMMSARTMDVNGKINSSNLGFIDTNCDGVEDSDADEIAAQDRFYYNLQKSQNQKSMAQLSYEQTIAE